MIITIFLLGVRIKLFIYKFIVYIHIKAFYYIFVFIIKDVNDEWKLYIEYQKNICWNLNFIKKYNNYIILLFLYITSILFTILKIFILSIIFTINDFNFFTSIFLLIKSDIL